MDSLYIDDGYTAHRTIPAVAGLYPELRVDYRPALARERYAYKRKLDGADPDATIAHESELIAAHVKLLNGEALEKKKLAAMKPAVRSHLIDLVLGYLPEDEAKDAGN